MWSSLLTLAHISRCCPGRRVRLPANGAGNGGEVSGKGEAMASATSDPRKVSQPVPSRSGAKARARSSVRPRAKALDRSPKKAPPSRAKKTVFLRAEPLTKPAYRGKAPDVN